MAKKTILLVDDHETILELYQFYLQTSLNEKDYEIATARNGLEVLKRLEEKKPHLVVLDIMMPGMDGIAVCEAIKKNPKWTDVKVVVLSALDTIDVQEKLRLLGVTHYFAKPADPGKLVEFVQRAIAEA